MTKLIKFKFVIISVAVLAIITSITAFSVSYAKWTGGETTITSNANTGYWLGYKYSVVIDNGKSFEIKEVIDYDTGKPTGKYQSVFFIEQTNSDIDKQFRVFFNGQSLNYEYNDDDKIIKLFENYGNYFQANVCGLIEVEMSEDSIKFNYVDFTSGNIDSGLVKQILNSCGYSSGIVTSSGRVIEIKDNNANFELAENEKIVIGIGNGNSFSLVGSGTTAYYLLDGNSNIKGDGTDTSILTGSAGEYSLSIDTKKVTVKLTNSEKP